MHILDKVFEIYEDVAFISNSEEEKELAIPNAEETTAQVKGIGPEERKSLSWDHFEITMAGQQ